jgi:hypothetical protein
MEIGTNPQALKQRMMLSKKPEGEGEREGDGEKRRQTESEW